MMDVTFNSTFAVTLQHELHQPVLSLPLSLQIGDLTRLTTDDPAQLAIMSHSTDATVVKQALVTLKSQVEQGRATSMVVYHARWLVRIRLVVSAVSRHRRAIETSDGTAKSSDNSARSSFTDFVGFIGSIASGYCAYLQLAQDVSEDEQRAHSYEWQALVVENEPLRSILTGT